MFFLIRFIAFFIPMHTLGIKSNYFFVQIPLHLASSSVISCTEIHYSLHQDSAYIPPPLDKLLYTGTSYIYDMYTGKIYNLTPHTLLIFRHAHY